MATLSVLKFNDPIVNLTAHRTLDGLSSLYIQFIHHVIPFSLVGCCGPNLRTVAVFFQGRMLAQRDAPQLGFRATLHGSNSGKYTTTLQHYRLPSVTTNVTRRTSEQDLFDPEHEHTIAA